MLERSDFCQECLAYRWPEDPTLKHYIYCSTITGLHPAEGGMCYICETNFRPGDTFVYIDPTSKEAKGADLVGFPTCLGCAVYAVIMP